MFEQDGQNVNICGFSEVANKIDNYLVVEK